MQHERHVAPLDLLVPDETGSNREYFRIGDLSREFGVTLRTLRFYEDKGLIAPGREGSTRLYTAKERLRLKLILLAKQVGFSLVEIQELMTIHDKAEAGENAVSVVLGKFQNQMNVLKRQKKDLEEAIARLADVIGTLAGATQS